MATTAQQELEEDLRAGADSLYDDLAVVSCSAANELDRVMHQCDADLETVTRLVHRIETWIPKIEQAGAARSLADSNTVVAMACALPRGAEDTRAVAAGAKEMTSLLNRITRPDPGTAPTQEDLSQARSFCLKFSKAVRAMDYPPDINEVLTEGR